MQSYRSSLVIGVLVLVLAAYATIPIVGAELPHFSKDAQALLDVVQRHTFLFFWEQTDERGFTIESTAWPIGSIASSGFYLTSIPIAIERGWVLYEDGRDRVLTTLRSYADFVENEHGFFPHWFDQETGKWNGVDVFSSIDTAILMAGVLAVRQYFAGLEGAVEQEIVGIATDLYEAVDWDWMTNKGCTLTMGWRPDTGFHPARWTGYNEGTLAVLLALGSPTHPITKQRCDDPWQEWARAYNWAEYVYGDQTYRFIESTSTSLFTYQYPQIWFDLRDKKDSFLIDYFRNSRMASLENRAYCMENPGGYIGYGPDLWGLTACECPLHDTYYGAHGPRQEDDGTVAPTGVISSIVFTPEETIAALVYMYETCAEKLWGRYGFRDAFNLNIEWFSPTYIGIDQGAILTMIENYRTGFVWSLFMQNEYAKEALRRAGFVGADSTPPAIVHGPFLADRSPVIKVKVTDNTGVDSVALYFNDAVVNMHKNGLLYTAQIPVEVTRYRVEATDVNGNLAVVEYNRGRIPWVHTVKEPSRWVPEDAPLGATLIENFDDCCVCRYSLGAWYGGTSMPQDALVMLDGEVKRGEVGCSLKIAYNVQSGMFNGAWIKLNGLDLRDSGELVFWVKGDESKGYTTTFKIELKSTGGRAEYVVEGVTELWKQVAIPLNEFAAYNIDWSNVAELSVIFEDWRATQKRGVIYIDDIYLTPAAL
jgi:hypothetical protein